MQSRRNCLATIAAVTSAGLAGCFSGNAAGLTMSAATDPAEFAQRATTNMTEAAAAVHIPLLQEAVSDSAVRYDTSPPKFAPTRPVRWNNTVYEVDWEQKTESVSSGYRITARTPSDDSSEIAYGELSAADQQALGALEHRLSVFEDENPYLIPQAFAIDDSKLADSVLIPEQEYDVIRVDERRIGIEVSQATEIVTYRYTTSKLGSVEEYGTSILDSDAVELAEVSEEERAVITKAIEDKYWAESGDEAFESIVGRLVDHEPIVVSESEAGWPVQWDGTNYWTEVEFNGGYDTLQNKLDRYSE